MIISWNSATVNIKTIDLFINPISGQALLNFVGYRCHLGNENERQLEQSITKSLISESNHPCAMPTLLSCDKMVIEDVYR